VARTEERKKKQGKDQPLLRENQLMREGMISRPDTRMTQTPAVRKGQVLMRGHEVVREKVFERFLEIEGEQYRIQGNSLLELKENERLLRQQLEAGQYGDPTLNQYFAEWIERRRRTAAKPVTPYRYQMFYRNHIQDGMGRMRIRNIRRRDVLQLQAEALEKVSPGTVNYLIQLLKQILRDAVADEIIPRNPADNVKRLRSTGAAATDTSHRALTEEEQRDFLNAVRDSFYYEYFVFLLLTGMRQGESAALTWADMDFENNVIHVRQTLTFDGDGHIVTGPPKTSAGERDIPMNEDIRQTLRGQGLKMAETFGRQALADDQRVFLSSTGGVVHNAIANRAIGRALTKLEREGRPMDHFSAHALRDTFATRFIEQGGTPQTLKTILGHSSLKMTMDLYAHVLPNTKQKEMNRVRILGEALGEDT